MSENPPEKLTYLNMAVRAPHLASKALLRFHVVWIKKNVNAISVVKMMTLEVMGVSV